MRLLGNDLDLIELELDRGLAAEHRNDHADRILLDLNVLNGTGEGTQRTIHDPDGIANAVVDNDFLLFYTHGVDFKHTIKEFVICYLSEATEGQQICLDWQLDADGCLHVNGHRESTSVPDRRERVFAAQVSF